MIKGLEECPADSSSFQNISFPCTFLVANDSSAFAQPPTSTPQSHTFHPDGALLPVMSLSLSFSLFQQTWKL